MSHRYFPIATRAAAEAIGTASLLAIVVGSGITGERLAGGKLARAATDTFAGIRAANVPAFVGAPLVGGALGAARARWLTPAESAP